MRVIAGAYKGRYLTAPKGDGTRPTTDRVREALMSSLESHMGSIEGARVLDAFAGTGALGIEALSRGAARCTFFERSAKAASVVRGNISGIGIEKTRWSLVQRDIVSSAARAPLPGSPFTLVFLDPPYAMPADEVIALLESIAASKGIEEDAVIVYEHAEKDHAACEHAFSKAFSEVSAKRYGMTEITIYTARGSDDA